jgi:ankyrin repeat protein
VDELGRTPLHHAVGYSCSPAVIEILVSGPAGQTSVRVQDVEGRLPLHLTMRPYLLYTGVDHQIHPTSNLQLLEARRIMRATVAILINVCPKSVFLADDMDRTPLHYADSLRLDKNFGNCARHIIDELRMVESESRTTKGGGSSSRRHHGMVIEIASDTSKTDEDDLSVLSWE